MGVIKNQTIPLSTLSSHPRNYRGHPEEQVERLKASLRRFGQVRSIVVQEGAGGRYLLVAGHGITTAMKEEQYTEARADIIPADWSPEQVEGYLIADNMRGAVDDDLALAQMAQEQVNAGYPLESIGFSDDELAEMLERATAAALAQTASEEAEAIKEKKPNPRVLPLDVIYTLQRADCTCCLAVQAGLKYGIQSATYSLCPYTDVLGERHKVVFIDNDYFNYDHAVHLQVIKDLKPKYCTVRDIMTRSQCEEAGIEYYPVEQILEWADELAEYAENVILIPKYDCFEQLAHLDKAKFMLGYSIPTSHGGTPLSVEQFRGWRIHLLGGSWKAQLGYLAEFGEDVVSLDNNYILNVARFGRYNNKEGESLKLHDIVPELNNPRYVVLALSFGAIGAKVNELYGKEPDSDLVDDFGTDDEDTGEEA